jgi:hypothetical protein
MEQWLPVVGYEGLYEVSDRGRVRSLDRNVTTRAGVRRYKGRILRMTPVNGYPAVALSLVGKQDTRPVHLLLMEAFAGPCPEGQEVRHLNDVKTDCRWPENLAYGTRKENFKDRLRNGAGNRGERHGNAVTERGIVLDIRRRVAAGERQCDLAEEYSLTRANVWAIVHRVSWDWI